MLLLAVESEPSTVSCLRTDLLTWDILQSRESPLFSVEEVCMYR